MFLQIPVAVYYIWYVVTTMPEKAWQLWIGIPGAFIAMIICFIAPVFIMKKRANNYPLDVYKRQTMNITPGLVVSPNTDIFSADPGMIATAGGIDVHVHFDSLQLAWEALSNGLTTMLGGGTGPKTVGIEAPGAFNIARMIEAYESIPINMGQLGKGNSSLPNALVDQVLGGCLGLKLHEDWGSTPAAIDQCMRIADEYDFQVQIHTDTLNEAGFVERTLEAIDGRTMHAYHTAVSYTHLHLIYFLALGMLRRWF